MAAKPLAYTSTTEQSAAGETVAVASITRSMRGILDTTLRDYGHPARAVHAKSHALLEGELEVQGGLPAELAQGIFAEQGRYPVVLRFSTNPGDILDDTISTPRGLAIKIIGVSGERLPGSEHDSTQDFVMVNGPAFVAPNAAGFATSLKLLAGTTDTGQTWKKLFSGILRGLVRLGEATGLDASPLKALGGQPTTYPLGEIFYTQTPFRYGDHIAKLSIAPVSPRLLALKDRAVRLAGKPNGLRGALIDFFAGNEATWELRVQLRTNPASMPIEDATVPWPERESPYVAVARITVPRQPAWSEARARQVDDGMAFSPWHGITAHQPLGSINRARKQVYAMSAWFRGSHTGCPIHEPSGAPGLSADPAGVFGTTPGREGRRPRTPDARPGAWTQPMRPLARRIAGGAAGGLAAGALLSVLMAGMQQISGEPSDMVKLKRRTGARLGRNERRVQATPGIGDEIVSHGGHLALSAVAGAFYGAARPVGQPAIASGAAFGLGFYVLAHGVIGPATGVTPKLWKEEPASVARQGLFHLIFGIATTLVAEQIESKI